MVALSEQTSIRKRHHHPKLRQCENRIWRQNITVLFRSFPREIPEQNDL